MPQNLSFLKVIFQIRFSRLLKSFQLEFFFLKKFSPQNKYLEFTKENDFIEKCCCLFRLNENLHNLKVLNEWKSTSISLPKRKKKQNLCSNNETTDQFWYSLTRKRCDLATSWPNIRFWCAIDRVTDFFFVRWQNQPRFRAMVITLVNLKNN